MSVENPIFGDEENTLNEVMVQDMKGEKPAPGCFSIRERGSVVLIYCGDQPKSELNGVVWVIKSNAPKIQSESSMYCVKSCRKGVPRVLIVDYD
ncbi:hypothetical protein [Undibacterium sp. Ji50W]|uniref:hypothetical protein n=1 Tax=Undibacterium sp. Ji50W TaxID=3413041 RepID=UPI003BF5AC11